MTVGSPGCQKLGLNKADLPNSIKEVISTGAGGFWNLHRRWWGAWCLVRLKSQRLWCCDQRHPKPNQRSIWQTLPHHRTRFQLCHVFWSRYDWVATFRAPPKDNNHLTEDGMIMRDNVWGWYLSKMWCAAILVSMPCTISHLTTSFMIFCGGLKMLKTRTIRSARRHPKQVERPCTSATALRLKTKLQFDFDNALNQQFNAQTGHYWREGIPHRLYMKRKKMFTGGCAVPMLPLLFDYGAFSQLLFYPPTTVTPLLNQVTTKYRQAHR